MIAADGTNDELGIAEKIRDGELTSPQQVGEMALFALRVTGTGLSYRNGLKEYVWRDGSHYLNDRFLARCNGLPLIWEHPPTSLLNSEEFSDRIIGALMLPYIKGDEIWAVARVYDAAAIQLMKEEVLSTSPGVSFKPLDGGRTYEIDDENVLLIEGNPSLLDHLAICDVGVWDKGGPASGIESSAATERNDTMAEENKAAEERSDAAHNDLMTKLDAICDKLDAAHKRMDAMDEKSRKDAEEKEEKEREDKARKDAEAAEDKGEEKKVEKAEKEEDRDDSRKDARKDESFDKWAKEEAKEEEHKDSKKDSRKDARKDMEMMDADEKKEEERKDRADAALKQENDDLKKRLASVEDMVRGMNRETTPQERDALATAQARADSVSALFNQRASAPNVGETELSYRRRVLRPLLQHSPQFKEARLDSMDGPTLMLVENQVFADAQIASRVRADAQPGLLIPRISTDAAGRQITKFDGDMMAWLAPFMTDGARCKTQRPPSHP